MLRIKVNISDYHIFIHVPTNSYVITKKNSDSIFMKLIVIYDYQFERISDNQMINVQFLNLDETTNVYKLHDQNLKSVKVNELRNLPPAQRFGLKLKHAFGLH
jgi:hypothetical protein